MTFPRRILPAFFDQSGNAGESRRPTLQIKALVQSSRLMDRKKHIKAVATAAHRRPGAARQALGLWSRARLSGWLVNATGRTAASRKHPSESNAGVWDGLSVHISHLTQRSCGFAIAQTESSLGQRSVSSRSNRKHPERADHGFEEFFPEIRNYQIPCPIFPNRPLRGVEGRLDVDADHRGFLNGMGDCSSCREQVTAFLLGFFN